MPQYNFLIKILSIIFVAIGMVVAAAVWASGEHSNITTRALESDIVRETETKTFVKDHYTSVEAHAKLEQAFVDQKEDVAEIKNGINEIKNYLYTTRPRNNN